MCMCDETNLNGIDLIIVMPHSHTLIIGSALPVATISCYSYYFFQFLTVDLLPISHTSYTILLHFTSFIPEYKRDCHSSLYPLLLFLLIHITSFNPESENDCAESLLSEYPLLPLLLVHFTSFSTDSENDLAESLSVTVGSINTRIMMSRVGTQSTSLQISFNTFLTRSFPSN